jgi:uncharacterized membrane protein
MSAKSVRRVKSAGDWRENLWAVPGILLPLIILVFCGMLRVVRSFQHEGGTITANDLATCISALALVLMVYAAQVHTKVADLQKRLTELEEKVKAQP